LIAKKEFDVAVIGGGPAGCEAAIHAAKYGKQVVLLEKDMLGGTCLNHGCIPTKTLLHAVNLLFSINDSARFGIASNSGTIEFEKLRARKDKVIELLQSALLTRLEQHKVELLMGKALFRSANEIEVALTNGSIQTLYAHQIIIACGSHPRKLATRGGDSSHIMYPSDILALNSVPAELIFIGGGAVGLELATIMHRVGSKVSIIEIAPNLLPQEDSEITQILERALKKEGVLCYTGASIREIEAEQTKCIVRLSQSGDEQALEATRVCVCIGQQPYLSELGLEAIGIAFDQNGIKVDSRMQTSIPHIYAVGDVTGINLLAYVASAQGRIAGDNAAGRNESIDYNAIPRCVFTKPEIASVGLRESEAVAKGITVCVLRSSLAANSYATITNERRGIVKLIAEESGKLLGAHVAGTGAISFISECALAIRLGATVQDLAKTLHPHPTLSEALQEASLSWPVEK